MKKLVQIQLLWFIMLGIVSCRGDEPKRMPDTVPDITGSISSITEAVKDADKKNIRLQMLVQSQSMGGAQPVLPQANVRVTEATLIEDHDGKRLKAGQLQQGQQVEVWFNDPVMESMPVQATAKAVRVSLAPQKERNN